jgi:MFS family permease
MKLSFKPMLAIHNRRAIICALGVTQTLAWASTYYLPAILAEGMSKSLSTSPTMVFVAFTVALIASGFTGALIGRVIDQQGGRGVLVASSLLFALGLLGLSQANSLAGLFAAWLIIGIGMGMGLYDAAFSTLVRLLGSDARSAITGVTLFGGFASTIGWPLSHYFEVVFGWQGACIAWALIHLGVGLPLNAMLPKATPPQNSSILQTINSDIKPTQVNRIDFALVAFVFAVFSFITAAYATHFPRLLGLLGMSAAAAVVIGSLFGPAQVAARLIEFGFLRKFHPLKVARTAAVFHPLGALAIFLFGAPLAALFACLHGVCNGMMTISKGAVPLSLFGTQGFGKRQGYLMLASTLAQASAPIGFGAAVDSFGVSAFMVSFALSSAALTALLILSKRHLGTSP